MTFSGKGVKNTGPIWDGTKLRFDGPVGCLLGHTGVVKPGVVTINGGDTALFDITAGSGWVIDQTDPANPVCAFVEWDAFFGVTLTNLATASTSAIGIDANGDIVQKPNVPFDAVERRNVIGLATIIHPNGVSIDNIASVVTQPANDGILSFSDFIREVIGPANVDGNVFSANGANLSLNKSSGRSFLIGVEFNFNTQVPDISNDPSIIAASFFRTFRSAVPNVLLADGPPITVIDPNLFDDGSGVLQTVGNNRWTVQVLYWAPTGNSTGNILLAYGQETFGSQALALSAVRDGTLQFEERPDLQILLRRSFLVVQEGTTSLLVPTDAEFVEAPAFRIRGLAGASGIAGGVNVFRQSFTNADLTAGVLTVSHNLSQQYNTFDIWNGSNKHIGEPDDADATDSNTLLVDLSAFGTIVGTWHIVVEG